MIKKKEKGISKHLALQILVCLFALSVKNKDLLFTFHKPERISDLLLLLIWLSTLIISRKMTPCYDSLIKIALGIAVFVQNGIYCSQYAYTLQYTLPIIFFKLYWKQSRI